MPHLGILGADSVGRRMQHNIAKTCAFVSFIVAKYLNTLNTRGSESTERGLGRRVKYLRHFFGAVEESQFGCGGGKPSPIKTKIRQA